jgi:rhamnogalacturonyl hydrolase YesR
VRQLFDLHKLTGEKKYLDRAMEVTNIWYEKAWVQRWGHFIRKLNPDGKAAVNQLYGDGKYNTLYILVQAYHATKDPKYIQRFKQAWNNLLTMGKDGFVPECIEQGKMVNKYGLDQQQTIFIDILVSAYEASGDQEILEAAENLGNRILQRGEKVMRMEGGQAGQAFLRLALARQKISRLQVAVGKAGTRMKVTQNGNRVLEVIVPAEVAVVYLPEGVYNLEVGKHGFSRKKNIRLGGNNNEKFSI